MSRAVLLELQRRKLRKVFDYLCDTPFYREKLSGTAAGLDHDDPLTGLRRFRSPSNTSCAPHRPCCERRSAWPT